MRGEGRGGVGCVGVMGEEERGGSWKRGSGGWGRGVCEVVG